MVDQDALKFPIVNNNLAPRPDYTEIAAVICRKKGQVTVEFCSACPEFEPPDVGKLHEDDILEGLDGVDPHTGNSYATCKYFGQIVRNDPFYMEVLRMQEKKFGKL